VRAEGIVDRVDIAVWNRALTSAWWIISRGAKASASAMWATASTCKCSSTCFPSAKTAERIWRV
jgi:hypothetical protein